MDHCCTYDVLRASGMTPELTCHGCGNKISPHVTPWPGEGYITHPNHRCARAAGEKGAPSRRTIDAAQQEAPDAG